MTTRVFLSSGGSDRLIVSTILTHLVFFHEAGFAFRTERKAATRPVWWNPATWRGFRWVCSGDAEQPRKMRCTFNEGADATALGATSQSAPGSFKLSCDSLMVRRHCVWVVQGDGPRDEAAPAVDGRAVSVRAIEVSFDYGGRAHTVRHRSAVHWPAPFRFPRLQRPS